MKKIKLKHIIRESIKDLIKEQAKTSIRIYQGCNIQSGVNTGIFNNAGLSPTYTGIPINQMPPGSFNGLMFNNPPPPSSTVVAYEAMLTNNSNIIHNAWGSPSPGQVIRFCTCISDITNPQCRCTCMKYMGEATEWNHGNWNGGQLQVTNTGMGPSSNLSPNPSGQGSGQPYNSCQECDEANQNNGPGCVDQNATNYNQCCPDPITGVVDPNCTPNSSSECCIYGQPEKGCLDYMMNSQASNYGECCSGVPGCVPNSHDQSCCVYNEKGCLDKLAINYGECCDPTNTSPGCFPIYHVDDCCRYEPEPEPCQKCCCKKYTLPSEPEPFSIREQISIGGCIPGTEIILAPNADPCKCPAGYDEIPYNKCKSIPTTPDLPMTSLQEKFQKLANIKK